MMDTISYFIAQLKQNAILFSILTTGSLDNINISHLRHTINESRTHLVFEDFRLGSSDNFRKVEVLLKEDSYLLTFYSDSSKYFDKANLFFDNLTEYNNTIQSMLNSHGTFKEQIDEKEYDVIPVDFSRMPYVIIHVEKDNGKSTVTLQFLNKKNGNDMLRILQKIKEKLKRGIDSDQIKKHHFKNETAEGEMTYIEL